MAVEQRGAAATVLTEPTGLVEVRVVGGPAAGSVHRLGLGTSTIGSGRDVDVVLDDPSVPARSLRLTVGRDAVEVEPSAMTMQSSAALDGTPLGAKTIWPVGGMLSVGGSVLTLAPSAAPDTHLEPLPEGGLAFNRPPRLRPADRGGRWTSRNVPNGTRASGCGCSARCCSRRSGSSWRSRSASGGGRCSRWPGR